ncbi:mitogen-activated protein kinase kinase kinase A-like [Canna indica]|uniref:Mitogen-activated protein kinase kinase kinase A-like n=1 Tax=Canna indica TaxID=4628 RepID=A0AAQ3K9Q7_9LILI|nr:mitogen-activated protein kinase kinase kinase A-like [Canna indica]
MHHLSTEEDGEGVEPPLLPKTYTPDSKIYTSLMKGYMKEDWVDDVVCTQEVDPGGSRPHDEVEEFEGERHRVRGTPLFMASKVTRGEEQGPPADIWALDCTVIEMATDCPPWPDVPDPVAAIHWIVFSP